MLPSQHIAVVNIRGLAARPCYGYTKVCYTCAHSSTTGDTMDLQKLLTTKQKEDIVLAQLGIDTTRDDVVFKYDARYAWDFCVRRKMGTGSEIKVTFSVFITEPRFKAAVKELHRAIHEVRMGQLMIQGTEREVVLKPNGKGDLSLGLKLDAELGRILREHAYNSGFHPNASGVKKFLEKTFKGG